MLFTSIKEIKMLKKEINRLLSIEINRLRKVTNRLLSKGFNSLTRKINW